MKERPSSKPTNSRTVRWLTGLFIVAVGGFVLYTLLTSVSSMAQGIGIALIIALVLGVPAAYLYRQQNDTSAAG